jgi:hypothetical protein
MKGLIIGKVGQCKFSCCPSIVVQEHSTRVFPRQGRDRSFIFSSP